MEDIKKDKNEFLKGKSIALIGPMGAGKTTVGKALSKLLFLPFIDTDELIEKKYGKITDIFANHGEKIFREYETEIIKTLNGQAIISTGGGVVLNVENMKILKKSSIIVFLDRKLKYIKKTIGKDNMRPLASDIEKIYLQRRVLYETYADIHIKINAYPKKIAEHIIKLIKK